MFTTGQVYFGIFFFIAFVITMIFVYRKDIQLHRLHYKGAYQVLIAFLLFIAMLFLIKIYLKR
ncbi:MAG: hypothetical protein ACOVLC_05980 [Flavobacterium sp.]